MVVHDWGSKNAAVAFAGDGPGPASGGFRGKFRGKSFGGEGCMDLAEEGAENGDALDEDGAGNFGGVPYVRDAVAPWRLSAVSECGRSR